MDSAHTIGHTLRTTSQPGTGFVDLLQINGKTAITRCRANSPLRLLTPRSGESAARIVTGTYGGGLLDGDAIDLTIKAGPSTKCLLTTQASTKIYRSASLGTAQRITVSAADDALVVSLPDPIVCFAASRFRQRQQFNLSASASLLMLDWFTSGRAARDERWQMHHYASHTEITVASKCVFRDALELDPNDGKIGTQMRMGPVDCFATAVMVGPAFADQANQLVQLLQKQPLAQGDPLLFGASQFPPAAVIRLAGKSAEAVGDWLKQKLAFVTPFLGIDPWLRK